MSDIQFRDDFSVDLVSFNGGDESVLKAMLVSTLKDQDDIDPLTPQNMGRNNFLMKNRHGTPFEHNQMVFRVEAPIFVFREWHRHRIGVSINEQSGRYTEFTPVFYVPNKKRAIIQTGKPGAYIYSQGTEEQMISLRSSMMTQATLQWEAYQNMLEMGVALEVARMHLGVNIYSSQYWTCNARSLMAFLSLRTRDTYPGCDIPPAYPSKPMWEIDRCAQSLEEHFADLFPVTHKNFCENGRVAP